MIFNKGAIITEPGSTVKNITGVWRSMRPIIDKNKCDGEGSCWVFCPDNAVTIKNKKAVVDYNYCKGCGICASVCPQKAIHMAKEEK